MSKLFEYQPLDERIIVDRILVRVHRAIDESFPKLPPASRRFAKTVFADEPTVNQMLPADISKVLGNQDNSAALAETKEQLPITAARTGTMQTLSQMDVSDQPITPMSSYSSSISERLTEDPIGMRRFIRFIVMGALILAAGFVAFWLTSGRHLPPFPFHQ